MKVCDPTLDVERSLFAGGVEYVIGCDEVGRGALAGPVVVGAAAVAADVGPWPAGLRDSKMLSSARRERLAAQIPQWASAVATGAVDNRAIDRDGIVAALRGASSQAIGAVVAELPDDATIAVILDGSSDWLTNSLHSRADVVVRPKADRDCVSVAAASVIAKVARDAWMRRAHAEFPAYGWDHNVGYGSAQHRAAIVAMGASPLHRLTWLGKVLENARALPKSAPLDPHEDADARRAHRL